jgi:large subunit ribosomal protein L24
MIKECIKRTNKVRAGDKVIVIAGNCKGQVGTVISCMSDKVLIQGINLRKKHVKRSQQNPKGGVVEIERPIHVSNVCACDENGAPLKLKVRVDTKGEKELYYLKNGQPVIYRSMKRSKGGV